MDDKNKLKPGERLVEGKLSGQDTELGTVRGESLSSQQSPVAPLDTLTLHEERAVIDVVKEQAGAVTIQKVLRERQETIPVTLSSEVLEITVREGAGKVMMNGEVLEPGRTYEVLLQDERAEVLKHVFAVSEVDLKKKMQTFTHTETVTLRREELDIRDPNGLVQDVTLGKDLK